MIDEKRESPRRFILRAFDRSVLREPMPVEAAYIQDVPQQLQLQIRIYGVVRAILIRTLDVSGARHADQKVIDVYGARFMLEACKYALAWTEYEHESWIIQVYRRRLAGLIIGQVSGNGSVVQPSWIRSMTMLPEWAQGEKLAHVANDPSCGMAESLVAMMDRR